MARLTLTLRLAVYTLFGKARSNLGKNYFIPQNMHSRTFMCANTVHHRLWCTDRRQSVCNA